MVETLVVLTCREIGDHMILFKMEHGTSLQLLNASMVANVCLSLEELNASKANQRSPTVIFLCVLIVIGIIGNITVITVYSTKYSPSVFRLYIISLGFIDLLSCCIALPVEVADNALPLMFHVEEFCKIGRFLGNVFKLGSPFVLVVMAVGRYKRICHPYSNQITLFQARICLAAAMLLAVGLSWPNAIIQGIRHEPLPCNLTGYDCTVDDEVRNTRYPFLYSTLLFVVYILAFLLLALLYSFVVSKGKNAEKQGQNVNPGFTKLMIALTVALIVCYLPNCILDAITTFVRGRPFPPSALVLGLLPLLARTFFISSVINPFIYLIGETKFRKIVKQYLRWVLITLCCPYKKVEKSLNNYTETMPLSEMRSVSE